MINDTDICELYTKGQHDLVNNRKLGGEGFGLSFILPFAASVVRYDSYSDVLDWLDLEALSREERKAIELVALPLLKSPEGRGDLYEQRVDYHVRLYMIWTWCKRFSGIDTPPKSVRRGMFGRSISRERSPIPRKYLRSEPRGISLWTGSPRRHAHPTAIAVDVVRMVVAHGLDEAGEPLPPPDGYELGVDGD
ncbi:MAG: hypothetical protein AAFW59_01355 [Pseudomonadota bacterium]